MEGEEERGLRRGPFQCRGGRFSAAAAVSMPRPISFGGGGGFESAAAVSVRRKPY